MHFIFRNNLSCYFHQTHHFQVPSEIKYISIYVHDGIPRFSLNREIRPCRNSSPSRLQRQHLTQINLSHSRDVWKSVLLASNQVKGDCESLESISIVDSPYCGGYLCANTDSQNRAVLGLAMSDTPLSCDLMGWRAAGGNGAASTYDFSLSPSLPLPLTFSFLRIMTICNGIF